jgi:hypothetical protein
MATKQFALDLSYVKGTTYPWNTMKDVAKQLGVTMQADHSPYVGHKGVRLTGGKRALTKFCRTVGLDWAVKFPDWMTPTSRRK